MKKHKHEWGPDFTGTWMQCHKCGEQRDETRDILGPIIGLVFFIPIGVALGRVWWEIVKLAFTWH